MLVLSCRCVLNFAVVTIACGASVCRDDARTLALDRKLEARAALSPGSRGGISLGGAAGSNVLFAKATGCLLIVGTEASLSWRRDERARHANQPRISAPSNTQSTIRPREDNTASSFHLPSKAVPEPWICGWRMTRKV